ncbi:MAG: acyl--CoA ligase [Chloroflexi bacterium]|nr:acyl--CoA ligase [Chloroflexota bacterium]
MQANFAIEALKHAAIRPNSIAIRSEEHGAFTYQWLSEQARRFGNVLKHLGVGRGDRYLCFLPSIPDTAAVFLGGQLIGSIPVMVFLGYKEKELQHVFHSAEAKLVITTAQLRGSVERVRAACGPECMIVLDEAVEEVPTLSRPSDTQFSYFQLMSEASTEMIPVSTDENEIAELLFTSGTTGAPKGIPHTHGNIIRQCGITTSVIWPDLGPGDVLYTPAPIAFAIGLHSHFHFCFHTGASSLYCTERPSPHRFLELVERHRVTHIMTTSTHLWNVLAVPPQPERTKTVRAMSVGGSPVTGDLFKRWKEAYGLALRPSLAMTETLGAALGSRAEEGRPDTLGKRLPGWETRVVDTEDNEGWREVEKGCVGILWLKGPTVLPYYWNAEELTGETLRDGWLNTGDLVYEDDDGYFHHVSRADDVIKSAGWRISPVEIEDVLVEHDLVEQVAVVGVDDPRRGQAVVAVLVTSEPVVNEAALVSDLQAFAHERLAGYKVPERFIFRDSLPRTATGKIQRKELVAVLSEQKG